MSDDFPVDPLGTHPDPLVAALIAHQRHTIGSCLCGWGELGKSHAKHVAGIIRPIVEAKTRAKVATELRRMRQARMRAAARATEDGDDATAERCERDAQCFRVAAVVADGDDRIAARIERDAPPATHLIECLTDQCSACPGRRPGPGVIVEPICCCPCHVEAEVREQIAQEIEALAAQYDKRAHGSPHPWLNPATPVELGAQADALQRAARIARGGDQ